MIVFTRYPVPGKVKTRLIPALGPTGAAELHRRFTEAALSKARHYALGREVDVEVCFEGGSKRQVTRWLGSGPLLSLQAGRDLGTRMESAFNAAFRGGCRRVVLFGTDIPGFELSHLKKAFHALRENDLVLGPSTDGGYWLMGLKRPADLFKGMTWGERDVLKKTLGKARGAGLSTRLLEPLTDVDTPSDLKAHLPELHDLQPYVSVIIPALNEAETLKSTIDRARCDDAEVLVVDGGSRDETLSVAEGLGVRVLRSQRGRAVQQNHGAAEAKGRVFLFLHADTILPIGYVGHVFEILMDRRVAAGAFRFRTDLSGCFMRLIESLTDLRSRCLKLPYGDQGLFMRRETFRSAGGFPDIPIAEDLFLVRRMASMGRVETARAAAVTSARRWRERGVLRNTLLNQVVLAGLFLGVSPVTLARLYRGM